MAEQRSFHSSKRSQLPTPPAQSHEQQYESHSTSWPATDHRRFNDTVQASAKRPLSQNESPSISGSLHNPPSSQTSSAPILYGNVKQLPQTVVMPFQALLQGPADAYNGVVTQCQQSSFRSSSACSLGQTSASDPVPVLTSDGSYFVPVDLHQGSRQSAEKRARNVGASARFRQRRKEKETEAKSSIEKLKASTIELEEKLRQVKQERDFYRAERDQVRDVVSETPGFRHHAMCGLPNPQSMRSASLRGLMPQIVDPHVLPQTAFHATDPTSERPSKRRRKSTQVGYTSTEHLLPLATHTFVRGGFSPRPTLSL